LLGGFVVALPVVQLINQNTKTFPLVAWTMFTRPVGGDPLYYEYSAVLRSGHEVDLHVEDLFPWAMGRNTLIVLAHLAPHALPEHAGPDTARYETFLQALGRKYSAAHPQDPVELVRVWQCQVPLDDYHGPGSIQRRHVHSVAIP
jgi:hypothetical protein